MIQKTLILSVAATGLLAAPAYAQSANTAVVREAIPAQTNVIVANSPEDIAMQEEIRKIRIYNARIDQQVGISEAYSARETAPIPAANPYLGQQVELFTPHAAQSTQITYGSGPAQIVPVSTVTTRSQIVGATRHTIIEGDTLYRLSKVRCIKVADIQKANLMSGIDLQLGAKINLPASQCGGNVIASSTSAPAPTTTRIATPATRSTARNVMQVPTSIKIGNPNEYSVLPADTLYSIARLTCTNAQDIATHNNMDLNAPIHPGQTLRMPLGDCTKK